MNGLETFQIGIQPQSKLPNLLKALWRLWSFFLYIYILFFFFFFFISFPALPRAPTLYLHCQGKAHYFKPTHTHTAPGSVGFPPATKARKKRSNSRVVWHIRQDGSVSDPLDAIPQVQICHCHNSYSDCCSTILGLSVVSLSKKTKMPRMPRN